MKKLIFSTNTNLDLAKKISAKTSLHLGRADIKKFADQEISILVKENVKNKEVYVLGSSFPPGDNFLELLILINTLKVNGAKKIITIMPYFAYAKADHIKPKGSSLAGKLMAKTLEIAGADKIIAINLHSKKMESFFTKPLVHLSVMSLLSKHFKKKRIKDLVVASPDLGGVERAKEFAENLDIENIVFIKKTREGFDKIKEMKLKGNVKNKNVVIVDDMIQSGSTLIKAVKTLKRGGAKDIYIAVAHLVFTGPSVSLLQKEKDIKQILITDTIPASIKLPSKFKQISVKDILISALNREL